MYHNSFWFVELVSKISKIVAGVDIFMLRGFLIVPNDPELLESLSVACVAISWLDPSTRINISIVLGRSHLGISLFILLTP